MKDILVTIAWVTLVTEYYKEVTTCNYGMCRQLGLFTYLVEHLFSSHLVFRVTLYLVSPPRVITKKEG